MKKIMTIAVCLFMLFSLIACSNKKNEYGFFGTYAFEELSYLSLASSSTKDYFEEGMAGTKYKIEDNQFKIEDADTTTVEIESPKYVREEVSPNKNILSNEAELSNVQSILGEEIQYQIKIYKENGSKTNWMLYVSSDALWVATYFDNTADGSEYISNIVKVSKQ